MVPHWTMVIGTNDYSLQRPSRNCVDWLRHLSETTYMRVLNCVNSSLVLILRLTGMSKLYDSLRSLGTDEGSPNAAPQRQEQPMPSSESLGASTVPDTESGYKKPQQLQKLHEADQHQKDIPLPLQQQEQPSQQRAPSFDAGAQSMLPVSISQARPVIYLLHNASTRQ